MEEKNFCFLAHRVESWNFLLNFRLFGHLCRWPRLHWLWIWLWPVCVIVSAVQLFGRKAFDVVDRFRFGGMNGQTVLLRNYGWHFLFGFARRKIKERILDAVLTAQHENEVVGLGALVKAEWLTKGGRWIVDELGDKLTAHLVHGDTLTAAACLKTIDAVRRKYSISSPVFITGATSKIGRALVLGLAKNRILVKMYTKSSERFEAIKEEAGDFGRFVTMSGSLRDGSGCGIWLTGKSSPSGGILLRAIPKGAVVINFSVPNPLGEDNVRPRSDLIMVEGGLLAYGPGVTNLRFTMRLRPGVTYACHAGSMVHAYKGWTYHEVDAVDVRQLRLVWEAAQELGFSLLPLPEAMVVKESRSLWKKLAEVPGTIVL